jgi:hypothetical protein
VLILRLYADLTPRVGRDFQALSERMPIQDGTISAAPRTVIYIALVALLFFKMGSSRADDRSQSYLNDMKIMACVTAENAVRARLKDQGLVSFESCASNRFDVELAADDRDYKVVGYAIVVSSKTRSERKRFFVDMNHYPGSYGDWGFVVTKIELAP